MLELTLPIHTCTYHTQRILVIDALTSIRITTNYNIIQIQPPKWYKSLYKKLKMKHLKYNRSDVNTCLDWAGTPDAATVELEAWLTLWIFFGMLTGVPIFYQGFFLYLSLLFSSLGCPHVRLLWPNCLYFLHLLVPLNWMVDSCKGIGGLLFFLLCFSGLLLVLSSKGGSKAGNALSPRSMSQEWVYCAIIKLSISLTMKPTTTIIIQHVV